MTSKSPRPAAATAPAPLDSAAAAAELHPALVALVRLLARQVVHEWLVQAPMTEVEEADATSVSHTVLSPGERP